MTLEELQTHMDARFDELDRLLVRLQSDLAQFYRELGYQDRRLDVHDERLDNLEGK